ncbi:MAG: hypothetical protein JST82_14810 [Bacteroidetes bacterium]|nr:hypothetical protein [Bacteroidota bacterium]
MTEVIQDKRNITFYIKRILGLILLLSLAAVFFFSAISKLADIQPFEWTFIDLGISSNLWASVIAHLFIGLELMIGSFLLFHIYLKEVTYPITIALLLLLTGYLVMLLMQHGNNGDCGCFGKWLYMNPLQSILKNIAMIIAVIVLMFIYPIKPYKYQEWLSAVIAMSAIVAAFLIAPLNTHNKPDITSEPINLTGLYADSTNKPLTELRTGKHIVAFMSLTCPHCRKAAYLLHVIQEKNPQIPIYLILAGNPSNEKVFFTETKAGNLPYILYKNTATFDQLAGEGVPAIYWINNSVIERKSTYLQLDPAEIKNWLKD